MAHGGFVPPYAQVHRSDRSRTGVDPRRIRRSHRSYASAGPAEQSHLHSYVESMLEHFWAFRESKENFAVAATAVFLGAVATALVSRDWPPEFAQARPGLISLRLRSCGYHHKPAGRAGGHG